MCMSVMRGTLVPNHLNSDGLWLQYELNRHTFRDVCPMVRDIRVTGSDPGTDTAIAEWLKPNTHRRRRRDWTADLSRVGGVNTPVSSRDPVYNFLCRWAIEVGDKWRDNDIIVEKVINIEQYHVVKPLWSLFGQFPNCRPNPLAVVVS